MKLDGRRAVVVGAGGVVGRAMATSLAEEGADVMCADLDGAQAAGTAHEIIASGGTATSSSVDVRDSWSLSALAEATIDVFGGIDLLVYSASQHLGGYMEPCTEIKDDDWHELLDLNVTGLLHCVRAFVPSMRARGGGCIVVRGSSSGYRPVHAYGVARLAQMGLVMSLAHELGRDNIRVNCIAPALLDSPAITRGLSTDVRDGFINRQQLHRVGNAADIAGALLYLASDDASFVTGQTIRVDGGLNPHL